ncbi:MAG: hypothetical protein V3T23_07500 [Nitrososphaerales archaeon]
MTDLVDNCITCHSEFTSSKEDPQVQCYECWDSDVDNLWPEPTGETKFLICMMIAAIIGAFTLLTW